MSDLTSKNIARLAAAPDAILETSKVQLINTLLPQAAGRKISLRVIDTSHGYAFTSATGNLFVHLSGSACTLFGGAALGPGSFAICSAGPTELTPVSLTPPSRILMVELFSEHEHDTVVKALAGLDDMPGFSEQLTVRSLFRGLRVYDDSMFGCVATLEPNYTYSSPPEDKDSLLVVLAGGGGCRIGPGRLTPINQSNVVFVPARLSSALRSGPNGLTVLMIELPAISTRG